MSITLLFPIFFQALYQPSFNDFSVRDKRLLDSLLYSMTESREDAKEIDSLPSFKSFDPNKSSAEDLEKIFGKHLAHTIVKFRNKGGQFREKKDLKKIFGITEEKYLQVESLLLLPDSLTSVKVEKKSVFANKSSSERRTVASIYFDINHTDTSELAKLKGIGNVLAGRIVKYRSKLGGFISKEQYAEIYGLSAEVLMELKDKTFISENFFPQKININTAKLNEFYAHPYIGKRAGQLIINFREQHGKFNSIEQLMDLKALSKEEILRFLPYITV